VSRVVVVGATGNVGTSLLAALEADDSVGEIVGVARRPPTVTRAKTTWVAADVARDDLVSVFRGAECVVHLAWLIQPSHDLPVLRRTNVDGTRRLLDAIVAAEVPALVYASSVGAYSAGPKNEAVDESWPTEGTPTSFYARHKAEVERLLDDLEERHPEIRVVRLRPGLIFKRSSATEQQRFFLGPLFPRRLVARETIPLVPNLDRLRFQALHADDVAEAYRLAIRGSARGAFNVAAEPVLDGQELARTLRARTVTVSRGVARAALAATWKLRLQPTPPGWLDMALSVPIMSTRRAHEELGWRPLRTSTEAVLELVAGLREGARGETPVLS
jgi:UDP-glucose 4-epimerase